MAPVSATTKAGVQRLFARVPIESFLVDAALIVAWHIVMAPLTRVMSAHLSAAILGVVLLQVVAAGRAAGNIFFSTWDASEGLDATPPPPRGADAALLLVYLLTTEALLFASLGDQRREHLAVLFFCALVYLPCRLAFAFAPPTSRYEPLSALAAFVWFLVAAA